MHAMIVRTLDGPSALERVELPDPTPGPDEVVVKVEVAGCNFFDILITQGRYQVRPEPPFAPGAEVAGVVAAVGKDVRTVRAGDRVAALLPYGGYASHVVVPTDRVFTIPDGISLEDAAAMGIVYQTSYFALVHRAALKAGETLLVHAAAGGVGLAAMQIGRALGAIVIGTAGSDDKLALVRGQGAHHALSYRDASWVDEVKALTNDRGADVIYDPVGGETFDLSTKCIAFEGRLLVIGFASGTIPSLAMNRVLLKNFAAIGLHWGAYFEHDPGKIRDAQAALFAMRREGKIAPLISAHHPLADAAKALAALGSRATTGKVLLRP